MRNWLKIGALVWLVTACGGAKKIPEFMRGVGRGVKEFKDAKDNVKSEIEAGMKDSETKA